jgi:lipoyl-dependent peroxiredoxin
MKIRKAHAKWEGNLQNGKGEVKLDSLNQKFAYNFKSRFEEGDETNPEELIAAAHSGCFSMALSLVLSEKGYEPKSIETESEVTLEKKENGFAISKSHLKLQANVPGIDNDLFQELANAAKNNCPVSKALGAIEITMDAKLK